MTLRTFSYFLSHVFQITSIEMKELARKLSNNPITDLDVKVILPIFIFTTHPKLLDRLN